MRLLLVGPMAVLLALEVYHCFRRNGARFTATFFGAAILFGVIRANAVGFVNWSQGAGMPYIVPDGVRIGFSSLVEPFGWAFALYGSWFLAEGMLRKGTGRPAEVFPTALIAALLMGAFGYAVEAAATPMNWWHWSMVNVGSPHVYAVPVIGIMDWASMSPDLLLPFLIIEASSWGRSRWSYLFLLAFPLHKVAHFHPVYLPHMLQLFDVWHWVSVWAIAAAALVWPLELRLPRDPERRATLHGGPLDIIPYASVAVMLAIVAYAALGLAGDPRLLYSVLPLAAAIALAAPGVPIWLVTAALAAGSLASVYVIPALLPAVAVWGYSSLWVRRRSLAPRLAVAAIIAASLVAYYPWAWGRSEWMGRLAESLNAGSEASDRGGSEEAVRHYRASYDVIAKFAGGDAVLCNVLRHSWLSRDREGFDFAARELSGVGPQFRDMKDLWEVASREEFDRRLDAARAVGRPHR